MVGIIYYVAFSNWFLPLSNMHSRFSPYLFDGLAVHFVLMLKNIPLSGCTYLFVHSLTEGLLDSFKFLATMNKAAIGIHMQISHIVFDSFGCDWWAHGKSLFSSVRTAGLLCSGRTVFHSHWGWMCIPVAPTSPAFTVARAPQLGCSDRLCSSYHIAALQSALPDDIRNTFTYAYLPPVCLLCWGIC